VSRCEFCRGYWRRWAVTSFKLDERRVRRRQVLHILLSTIARSELETHQGASLDGDAKCGCGVGAS
jgi:hypothetical protein